MELSMIVGAISAWLGYAGMGWHMGNGKHRA